MNFYTRYSVPPKVGLEFNEPSMTEQHFKDECDINTIISQYNKTGVMPSGTRQPLFGDFADFPQDLQSSQAFFDDAHERFMSLPSNVRKEFNNDPVQLLSFLQDESNREKAIEYGFIERPQQLSDDVSSESTNVSTPPSSEGKK